MQQVRITNQSRPNTPAVQAGYCSSFLCLLRGLMFRRDIKKDEGLLLVQSRANRVDAAIHMFFMNFDITAVWIDDQQRVVDVRLARRWRPAYIPASAARYVLETHAARLHDFQAGDQLIIQPC